jgi:hypothetical protein
MALCSYTMIRTQVQLDEPTYEALRQKAFAERKSFSALVREILSKALGRPSRRKRGTFTFVGMVRGRKRDVSARHDEYLGRKNRW